MPRAAKKIEAIPSESPKRGARVSSGRAPDRATTPELAAALGVTEGAIRAATKSGRIKKGPDGCYDREIAMRDFERSRSHPAGPGRGNTGPMVGGRAVPETAEDYCPTCGIVRDLQFWRTLSEREKYRSERLKRLELEGALVRRSVADATLADLAAITRSLLEGVAAQVRDDLAAETDPRKCGDIVDAEIRLALGQAAEQFAQASGESLDDDEPPPDLDEKDGDEEDA